MTADPFPAALRSRLRASAGRDVPHPGRLAPAAPAAPDEALARFTVACEAVGGRVSRATDAGEVAALAADYLATFDAATAAQARHAAAATAPGAGAPFCAWDDAHLPLRGVLDALEACGAMRLDACVAADASASASDLARLDAAVVGITGAHAALADTGSLVLVHGAGRSRLVSLLPPVHVALVHVDRLHATFDALLATEPELLRQSANVVLVTGPSRTADIEMTLTRGVHGPRLVHVVFVG